MKTIKTKYFNPYQAEYGRKNANPEQTDLAAVCAGSKMFANQVHSTLAPRPPQILCQMQPDQQASPLLKFNIMSLKYVCPANIYLFYRDR